MVALRGGALKGISAYKAIARLKGLAVITENTESEFSSRLQEIADEIDRLSGCSKIREPARQLFIA